MKAAQIAHAQCMRTHGVPGYPDPGFPSSGGIAITDAGTNPQSPAYHGVMCLVRARGIERVEHDVLVVSIDRLTHVLRVTAGMGPGARSSG
jgi:hypothetical protein